MSVYTVAYFESQARLTTWTDELEFLGYILCELIDANGLNTTGYRYHQAADLPAIISLIRPQLKEPEGSLARMMSTDEVRDFRRLMRRAKEIRNMMTHHNMRNEDKMNDLEITKQRLSDMLEFAIRAAASDRGIYQVAWSPCLHICKTYIEENSPSTVMIPLNGAPLLPIRENILRDHDVQRKRLLQRRPKRKATEEGRRKQKDDYEAALIRKQHRRERDIAMRSNHIIVKLQKLEQRFIQSQELGYAQLNQVKMRMRDEQDLFHRQRANILKDGMLYPIGDEKSWLITIFLAISSPLWLTGVLMYNLYSRTQGRSSRA